ncbi:MAG: dicarboxylate/amino acid:cation symporter [Bacteroidales bacterium]
MKKIKISLLMRVILAIILGIVFGHFMPIGVARLFMTFNGLFANFLSFAIPLIIVGLVTPAIGELGKGAGKLLAITAIIAYASTLMSGFLTLATCDLIFPHILNTSGSDNLISYTGVTLTPYFQVSMPPLMDVMTALLLSFVVGLGLSVITGDTLKRSAIDFKEIISMLIAKAIVPVLPFYIFGIFLNMTMSGKVFTIMSMFIKVIILILILHVIILSIQYTIAGVVQKRNPILLFKNMISAYATALGTQSSAATIPVTLAQTIKNKVKESIAVFTVPLCATIHLSGSTMIITGGAVAIMVMSGQTVEIASMIGFVFMLGITMVAAPGVPSGAIMASLGILSSMLGFNETQQALMIALCVAMDSIGTATNVTGDGAISLIVDKIAEADGETKQS